MSAEKICVFLMNEVGQPLPIPGESTPTAAPFRA